MSSADPHPDLVVRHLDPREDDGRDGALLSAWVNGVTRGFHERRAGDELVRRWLEALRSEKHSVVRGAWPREVAVGDGTTPVATFAAWDGTMNVGDGATLPLRMVTDVTVAPTHRRRGLLRTLMAQDLAEAAHRGVPLAALTVSEGGIYGRFGFGPAHRTRRARLDASAGLAFRAPAGDDVPGARLELAEPPDAWPAVQSVFARHLAGQRGEVDRPSLYEPVLTGAFDFEEQEADSALRAVVHVDAAGEPDGYALFKHLGEKKPWTVRVVDLVGLDAAVELRLWRFVAEMDLVERVEIDHLPLDHPLDHALTDPRRLRTTKVGDMLWVAVLDVPTALEARPWFADGTVVLEVDDALGLSGGRWRVTVRDGAPSVEATGEDLTGDEPVVTLPADVLGSLYLGGFPVGTLAAAGRLRGADAALAAFAAMADGGPAPYCTTAF